MRVDRICLVALLTLGAGCATSNQRKANVDPASASANSRTSEGNTATSTQHIEGLLDSFHAAAAAANSKAYFECLAPEAVFIGTDASERWDVAGFRAYAEPYFSKGQGWTFVPTKRYVMLAAGGQCAWFDEQLANEKYGPTRGSGVVVLRDGKWRIAHYVLSMAIPNEVALEVAEVVRNAP